MGFNAIYQPSSGTSINEQSSYSALLSASKSLFHGDLMKDTSTGFYYRVWATNGPGVPVPTEYFDDVSGYLSNASGKAYIQPSDAIADLISRGWVNDSRHEGTVTKTANNPLILQLPAVHTLYGGAILEFGSNTANHHRYLAIIDVNSYDRGTNTSVGSFGLGVMLSAQLNNSTDTNSVRAITNFSHGATAGKLNFYMRTNTSIYNAGNGPNDAFTSGTIITAIDVNSDQLTRLAIPGSSQLKQSYDEATATAAFASVTDKFFFMVFDNTGTEALDLEINEAHILKI